MTDRRIDELKLRYTLRQIGNALGIECFQNPREPLTEFKLVRVIPGGFDRREQHLELSRDQAASLIRILGRALAKGDEL